MNIRTLSQVAAILIASLALCGCASGPKLPKYVEPKLPDEQVAVIRGHGGTTVMTVDNQEVSGSGMYMHNWGGNKVKLLPGRHTLTILNATSSGGAMNRTREREVNITHHFEAGHKYKIGPKSLFDRTILLHDETTDQPITIE